MFVEGSLESEGPDILVETDEQGLERRQVGEVEVEDLHVARADPGLAHLVEGAEPGALFPFVTLTADRSARRLELLGHVAVRLPRDPLPQRLVRAVAVQPGITGTCPLQTEVFGDLQVVENVAEEQRGEDLGLPFHEPGGRTGVVRATATIGGHSEGATKSVRDLHVVVVLVHPPVDGVVHEHLRSEVLDVPLPHRVRKWIRLITEREVVVPIPLAVPTETTETASTVVDEIDRGLNRLTVVVVEVAELIQDLEGLGVVPLDLVGDVDVAVVSAHVVDEFLVYISVIPAEVIGYLG